LKLGSIEIHTISTCKESTMNKKNECYDPAAKLLQIVPAPPEALATADECLALAPTVEQ